MSYFYVFLIIWFTVGFVVGVAAVISICKDDNQLTFTSLLMGIIMTCGGFVSALFGILAFLEKDIRIVKFEK